MVRYLIVKRQGVVFVLALVAYLICGFAILGHMGSTTSMFSGPEAEAGLAFWNTVIAIVALVQGVLGLIAISGPPPGAKRPLIFAILNVVVCAAFVVFYGGFVIAVQVQG